MATPGKPGHPGKGRDCGKVGRGHKTGQRGKVSRPGKLGQGRKATPMRQGRQWQAMAGKEISPSTPATPGRRRPQMTTAGSHRQRPANASHGCRARSRPVRP